MAIHTKGTYLYLIDPDTNAVVNVGCATSISGVETSATQVETTCLEADAKTYTAGLKEPGTATFELNMDPSSSSHVLVYSLKEAGTTVEWAIGWGDGTAAPTANSGGSFVLPSTRSWLAFSGYVASFPFDFSLDNVVKSNVGIQISGNVTLTPKT